MMTIDIRKHYGIMKNFFMFATMKISRFVEWYCGSLIFLFGNAPNANASSNT